MNIFGGAPSPGIFSGASPLMGALSPEQQQAANKQGMLAMAMQLLQSGGPSRTPVKLGQAVGSAFGSGMEAAGGYAGQAPALMQFKQMQQEMDARSALADLYRGQLGGAAQQPQPSGAPDMRLPGATGGAPIFGGSPQQAPNAGIFQNPDLIARIVQGGGQLPSYQKYDPKTGMDQTVYGIEPTGNVRKGPDLTDLQRTAQQLYPNDSAKQASYIRDVQLKPNSVVNIGPAATEVQKAIGENVAGAIQTGNAADKRLEQLSTLNNVLDAYEAAGGETGPLANSKLTAGAWLQSVGLGGAADALGVGGDVTALGQTLKAQTTQLLSGLIGPGGLLPSNNFSESDRQTVLSTIPSLGDTPQGYRLKLKVAGKVAERQRDIGQRTIELIDGGMKETAALKQAQAEARSANVFTPKEIEELKAAAAAPKAAKPAAPGTRGTINGRPAHVDAQGQVVFDD